VRRALSTCLYGASVLTISMNEAAASALHPLVITDPAARAAEFDEDLRDKLAQGLFPDEDALVFAGHLPTGSARTAWPDLTGYECHVNGFHLEDHAPVRVAVLDDGQPSIGNDDQVVLLRLGMAVAEHVFGLVRALPRSGSDPLCHQR
jgi:hypothetical protein